MLDRPVEVVLRQREPRLRDLAALGFRDEMGAGEVRERRLSGEPVQCPAPLHPETLKTNVPGVHLAGSITRGYDISEVFIHNGPFDGDKIFGRGSPPNP